MKILPDGNVMITRYGGATPTRKVGFMILRKGHYTVGATGSGASTEIVFTPGRADNAQARFKAMLMGEEKAPDEVASVIAGGNNLETEEDFLKEMERRKSKPKKGGVEDWHQVQRARKKSKKEEEQRLQRENEEKKKDEDHKRQVEDSLRKLLEAQSSAKQQARQPPAQGQSQALPRKWATIASQPSKFDLVLGKTPVVPAVVVFCNETKEKMAEALGKVTTDASKAVVSIVKKSEGGRGERFELHCKTDDVQLVQSSVPTLVSHGIKAAIYREAVKGAAPKVAAAAAGLNDAILKGGVCRYYYNHVPCPHGQTCRFKCHKDIGK
jgi:hypothetical protein